MELKNAVFCSTLKGLNILVCCFPSAAAEGYSYLSPAGLVSNSNRITMAMHIQLTFLFGPTPLYFILFFIHDPDPSTSSGLQLAIQQIPVFYFSFSNASNRLSMPGIMAISTSERGTGSFAFSISVSHSSIHSNLGIFVTSI